MLDNSFERLKRYNLAEIFDPTPSGSGAIEEKNHETVTPPIIGAGDVLESQNAGNLPATSMDAL